MKKIINGKLYDTDTAALVGEWDNGLYGDRLNQCYEELYRKRTGEYFLHGWGGPMTKYSVSVGNNEWSGGEVIIPLTVQSAMEWAQEKLSGEDYQKIFGEIEEDDTKQAVTLSISVSNYRKAKRAAEIKGVTISALVDDLLGNL